MGHIVSKEEIIKFAKQLATAVDFELLEKKGVIEKKGAWYKIRDINSLPEYARQQVRAIKTDAKGNCLMQFRRPSKKAQQLYRRMSGKEFTD